MSSSSPAGGAPFRIRTEKDIPAAARVADMPLKVDLEGSRVLFRFRRHGSDELSPEMSLSWKFNNKPVGQWPRGASPSSTRYKKAKTPLSPEPSA
jgi:hypothetical protein